MKTHVTKPDNPPAFPIPNHVGPRGDYEYGFQGMSLLDYFAGQYLNGMSANPECSGKPDLYASEAYKFADAMLIERERRMA